MAPRTVIDYGGSYKCGKSTGWLASTSVLREAMLSVVGRLMKNLVNSEEVVPSNCLL